MAELQLPTLEYLGLTYDVSELDPMDLASTSKNQQVFDFTMNGGGTSLPKGVNHVSINKTELVSETSVVSSTYDLQTSMKSDVQIDAGLPGTFEFSLSRSVDECGQMTQSRKVTCGYTFCSRERHQLDVDILGPSSPYTMKEPFAEAVAALPVGDDASSAAPYDTFVEEFGTHFTRSVTLGGRAYQRTSGSASRLLQTSESVQNFKSKASGVIEQFSAGASVEEATKNAVSTDQQEDLHRETAKFYGGLGSLEGVKDTWLEKVEEQPVAVKARFERLSVLFQPKFFPKDPDIVAKGYLLDSAINRWIFAKGKLGCMTAPLRFGEPVVMVLPWPDGTLQYPMVFPQPQGTKLIPSYPVTGGKPVNSSDLSAAIVLEPYDQKRNGMPILSTDVYYIKLVESGLYLDDNGGFNADRAHAARLRIGHSDENIESLDVRNYPGLIFTEADNVILMYPRQAPGHAVSRFLSPHEGSRNLQASGRSVEFRLTRTDWPA